MTDLASVLNALRRPRILIRAARAGSLRLPPRPRPEAAAAPRAGARRRPRSAACWPRRTGSRSDARTSGEATYNLQRHVAVLTAILAEARLLPLAAARA